MKIARCSNVRLAGPESDKDFMGKVITHKVGQVGEFEIVLLYVPSQELAEASCQARDIGTRVTITTGGYSNSIEHIAPFIHVIDWSRWRRYRELLRDQ